MNSPHGHFSENGDSFTLTTPRPPRHWFNYFWNDQYVSFFSQVALGRGFTQDRLGNRIHLLSNRMVYLLDTEADDFWTANTVPLTENPPDFRCVHGLGYSTITRAHAGIQSAFRVFVPETEPCEIWTITLTNTGRKPRQLRVIHYLNTSLDGSELVPQGYNNSSGFYRADLHAVLGKNFGSFDGHKTGYAFLAMNQPVEAFDTRRSAFLADCGSEETPLAVVNGGCTNSVSEAEKLIFALQGSVALAPGETARFDLIAGVTVSEAEVARIRGRFADAEAVEKAFDAMRAKIQATVARPVIETPDPTLNRFFNHFLKHQVALGTRWARVRHNGYRDICQDSSNFALIDPAVALEHFTRILSYQYASGYAPRTFIDGKAHDRAFMDNPVWISYGVHDLLMETGDLALLDRDVPFLDNGSASIYEHMKRSVDWLWQQRGLHGLIKLGGGDWNDGLDYAGLKGKGVSVWLSMAWYLANAQFAEIAGLAGKPADQAAALARGAEMKAAVNTHAWDGDRYTMAVTDDGRVLGAQDSPEAKVYLMTQAWAVMSGIADDDRARQAMATVDARLSSPIGTLILDRGYGVLDEGIGHITMKHSGVQENGGVYLHANTFKMAADALLGRNRELAEELRHLLPFGDAEFAPLREPYVLCNSYFASDIPYRHGAPGQSWGTGSAGWLVKVLVNSIFGLRPTMTGLALEPCLPPAWESCAITRRFRGAEYHIHYAKPAGVAANRIVSITVNGIPLSGTVLPTGKPGETHQVQVQLA